MTAYQLCAPTGGEPGMSVRERKAAERERHSLADALVELAGPEPQTIDELHAAAVDDWGSCTLAEVAAQLRELRWAGLVRREGGGYVAAGGGW